MFSLSTTSAGLYTCNKPATTCASRSSSRAGVVRVLAAKGKDGKPDAVRPGGAPKKPDSRGPGSAPMYMETIEQRKAAKAFRKGGADDGGRGGGGGDDGGDDEGGWFGGDGDGEANPLGIGICLAAAVGAYFYYKGEETRKAEAKEAYMEAIREKQEAARQKRLVLKKKSRSIVPTA